METIRKTSINLSYLHTVSGGDPQFEKMLLSSAISDIEVNLQRLRSAWQQQDAQEVRSAAHTLKSLMVIAGLPQLEPACQSLDSGFSDGAFHAALQGHLNYVVQEWTGARPLLDDWLQDD